LSSTSFDTSANTAEIISFLDELLEPAAFDDYGPNGLQVPGADRVRKLVTGVSGQLELFRRAAASGAQLVLVHHGILWDFHPRRIDKAQHARLKALIEHDIALAAYHLPLDAHPVHGNNALLAAGLECTRTEPFGRHRGRDIGVAGHLDPPLALGALLDRIRALTGREPLVVGDGPELVRSVGIVSGAAAGDLAEAVGRGLDAFLTGEPRENVMADAREAGVHFIAAGHYATETFGIRRLGELVAERFGIEHIFVDIPNPI
jgi:dinuclear metal center YbgI/SA1388 family protein